MENTTLILPDIEEQFTLDIQGSDGATEADVRKTQRLLDNLCDKDKDVLSNLLLCAWMVAKIEEQGGDCSEYREKIRTIYKRWKARYYFVDATTQQQEKDTDEPLAGMSKKYLQAIVNEEDMPKVGSITVTVICIVAAVIVTYFAVSCYNDYKTAVANSTVDLKETEDIKKGLEQMDPDIREKFLDEVEKQLDEAYAKGYTKAKFESKLGGIGKTLLIAGLALGGLWLWANYGGQFKKKW